MNDYFSFQTLEFKRFFRKKKLIVFLLVFIIFVFSVNRSSVSFKRELANERELKANEAATFEKIVNYDHYSDKGINFLMVSSPTSIYFDNPNILSELSSRVNSIATLEINKNVQGKMVFKGNSLLELKFSNLVEYFGCFLALFIGAEAMSKREYLKMQRSRLPVWRVNIYTIFSRFIILFAAFILVSACMLLVPLLHGIGIADIDTGHLWGYLAGALLMLMFFLLVGHIMGSIARSKLGFTPLLIVWFVFIVVIPTISGSADEDIAESLQSIHKLYHDRLKIVTDWEKGLAEKNVTPNNTSIEEARKIVEAYYEKVYPSIEALEKELRDEIARLIKNHRDRSVWTPITFYNLLCSELSGRGYESYIRFLDFNIRKQREFLRFWINMRYYVHHEDKKLENFFKEEGANIFKSKGILPANIGMGFAVNIIYVLILLTASHFFFKQSLLRMNKEDKEKLGTVKAKMERKRLLPWFVEGNSFKNYLYNIFSGNSGKLAQKGIKGSVIIDNKDIGSETQKHDFFFLCRQEDLPEDVTVKSLIIFFASLNKVPAAERKSILAGAQLKPLLNRYVEDLENNEMIEVFIAVIHMVKAKIYLINDVATGLDGDYVVKWKDCMDELIDAGSLVVYLTTSTMSELHSKEHVKCYDEGDDWVLHVVAYKRQKERKEKRQNR